MTKNKPICAFYGIMPDMKTYLRKKMKKYDLVVASEKPLNAEKLNPDTEILGVFVDSKIDKNVFNKLKKLKLIVTMSTGFDHIDYVEAKKRKICVCNVPTYGENTVAQHAMALMLAMSRKLFQSVKRVKEGVFDYHGLRGFDMKDKVVGVIGTGHIGIHVIDMLQGFDVKIVAFDAFPNKDLAQKHNFTYVPLNKLLSSSDIISLHVPLLDSTLHMINKENVKKLKRGVLIINTARGALIEPEAMVYGLENGIISGAGLDVLEEESNIQHHEELLMNKVNRQDIKDTLMDNIIIDHPNTIVTPHNAFNSTEALRRIIDTTIDNIDCFMKKNIKNQVNAK